MNRLLRRRIIMILVFALVLVFSASGPAHIVHAKKTTESKKTSAKKKKKKKKAGMSLNKTKVTLHVGGATRLRVKRAAKKVKWSSSNNSIVTVKGYAKYYASVTAHSTGTATITAKVAGKKFQCKVHVIEWGDSEDPAAENSEWTHGSWTEDNCYVNASGTIMANLDVALTTAAPVRKKLKDYPYFYIGASRTKNTARSVKDKKVYFYYCGGAGFDWFFTAQKKGGSVKAPALQMIRSYLDQKPSGTVIIDLGGNDMNNIEAYIGFYRSLTATYPKAKFWFMGILPREKGDPSNSRRKAFNQRLEKEFPGQVINLFNKVYHMDGFTTKDGTHYNKKQSRKIYQMAMKKIGRNIIVNMKNGKVTSQKTSKKS